MTNAESTHATSATLSYIERSEAKMSRIPHCPSAGEEICL